MAIQYISRDEDFESCISKLSSAGEIAIDLEFDKNRYRYGFNLCLVQAYTGQTCFLIDPLSENIQIEKLFPVLENRDIQKVVFAFGEDLRLLHSIGCFPGNIYDLSIATSLLNYPPASLSNYIADILNLETGKSSQQSNWYRRPLSDKQKEYAAQDVLHLLTMKKIIEKEADKKNITKWICEENEVYHRLNYAGLDDNNFIKDKDKNGFTEFEWFLFKRLMEFREEISKRHNKPSYQMIDKNYISAIAKDPRKLGKWENTRGIYKKIKNNSTKEKISALLKASIREAHGLNLSETDPAEKKPGKEEINQLRKEREKVNRIKNEYFNPVKDLIGSYYGEAAASFILSNRIILELISGEAGHIENYKKELILNCAKELDLNLEVIYDVFT